MANINETGIICFRGPVKEGVSNNGNKYQSQEVVMEITHGTFSHKLAVRVANDLIAEVAAVPADARVKFSCRVAARSWQDQQGNTRWFNSVDLTHIELAEAARSAAPQPSAPVDDLPFN